MSARSKTTRRTTPPPTGFARPRAESGPATTANSGSAGDPALNVLQQEEVGNVVAVVTRYYGGRTSASAAWFSITVEYDDSGTVRGILESEGVEFEADYAERVGFGVRVPVADAAALRDRLRSATSGRADIDSDTRTAG